MKASEAERKLALAAIPRYYLDDGRAERRAAMLEAFFEEMDKQQSEWGRLMKEVMRVQAEDEEAASDASS